MTTSGPIVSRCMVLQMTDPVQPMAIPLLLLSGEVGDVGQEMLVPFLEALGLPRIARPAGDGALSFHPAAGDAWQIKVQDGIGRLYCPVLAGGSFCLVEHASCSTCPGWVEAAQELGGALVVGGPPLALVGGGRENPFDLIGDRPFCAGLVPAEFL